MRSIGEIKRTNAQTQFEEREALVVGFLGDGFKLYVVPEGKDAGDIAEEMHLLGMDWHVSSVHVPRLAVSRAMYSRFLVAFGNLMHNAKIGEVPTIEQVRSFLATVLLSEPQAADEATSNQ